MFGRISRRIDRAARQTRKQIARAVYSLPALARHNPRKKIVKFKDHCCETQSFPAPGELNGRDWYLKIRAAETGERKSPLSLDAAEAAKFRAETQRFQGGNRFTVPEIFLAGLHQAKLVSSDFVILTAADDILLESVFSLPEILETNGILDDLCRPVRRTLAGSYCMLASPWSRVGYYHWLIDALPRLSLIEQFAEFKDIRLIVPHELKTFQRQSLALAGIAPERLVGYDGRCTQFETLYYPEVLSPTGNPSRHAVQWLRERFQTKAPPVAGRRFYVSRRDAPQRRVLNEDAVIRCLEARGFEVVCPGDLSFADQIELFSQAAVVVGAHGAGLTNMVFAPANATLIELFGDNYINGCFWVVADLIGQKHAFLTGPHRALDYTIAPDRLNALLDQVDRSP